MKKFTYTLALLMLSLCVFAQKKNKYYTDEYGNPMHYDIGNPWTRNAIVVLVDGGTKRIDPFKRYGDDYASYGNLMYLEGATTIELESVIHKDSLKLFRYTIIENDSIYLQKDAIPHKIKFVWNERSDFPNHVTIDLGTINVVNKKIEVKIQKVGKKWEGLSQAVIYNKPLKPASIIYSTIYSKVKDKDRLVGKPFKNGDTIINDAQTRNLAVAIKSTDVNFLYEVKLSGQPDHELYLSSSQFRFDGKDKAVTEIDKRFFNKSGEYTLSITPRTGTMWDMAKWKDTEKTVKIKFTVIKKDEKTFKVREIIIIGLIAAGLFGAILGASLAYIKKKNQKKLFASQQQKDMAKMQLNSIRAQLNPHFMFNALAGIQNLMNHNKTEEANAYLGKFARLTRNVLDQKDMVSLTEEKELLEDYLQMEQLRFGFTYKIEMGDTLDLNIEIPSMLLQPFVENAVKHGIASKADEGQINVLFVSQNNDLVITIIDNGAGFDASQIYPGLGLQLSKNRISLLNTIYTTTPFVLAMKSDGKGTEISITLTQWI
jgi:two-component system LytT family sensor kinase